MKRLKAGHVVREREGGAADAQGQAVDLSHARFDHALLARQRYLSLAEAADYLRFPSPKAFHEWTRRQGLRACKAGRLNLYLRTELERWVEKTSGHGQESHGLKRSGLLRAIPRNPVTPE